MKTILFSFLIFSAVTTAGSFRHRFQHYPKGGLDCHTIAKELANRFETATGIVVTEAVCSSESQYGYHIELTYEAEEALSTVSTSYKAHSFYSERYNDLEKCEAELPLQVKIFEAATELSAVYQYCTPTSYTSRWSPIIESFGTARRLPQNGGYALFSSPSYIPKAEFVSGLKQRLEKSDAILSDIIILPQIGMAYASFHYFARGRLPFSLHELTSTLKEEQCEAQKQELLGLIHETTNPPFSAYCGYVGIGAQWELNLAFVDKPSFSWRNSIESFDTLEACEAARTQLTVTYQSNEKTILGGLCGRHAESNKFKVVLIKAK